MLLFSLILVPFMAGFVAWFSERWHRHAPFYIALISVAITTGLAIYIGLLPKMSGLPAAWWQMADYPLASRLGISAHLGMDGLSCLMVLMSLGLGLVALYNARESVLEKRGLFFCNLLWNLSGVIGVVLALDLFLFFIFWEAMLVPMYFLIGIWGFGQARAHGQDPRDAIRAAVKFFIFTQFSGLIMLVSILGLVLSHQAQTGVYTFDYLLLLGGKHGALGFWLMLGFFIAFIVKLPVFPFHAWLPDFHTHAPIAVSILLIKLGVYGLMRFALPLFPAESITIAPYAMTLGVISTLYGAILAFTQNDLRRLVAYATVSHMGFVLIGLYAQNIHAWQGVAMLMVAASVGTAALFFFAGAVYARTQTLDIQQLGGLYTKAPRMASLALVFTVAVLGMPGAGNFVGEILVLFGAWRADWLLTLIASSSLVISAVFALRLMQKTLYGEPQSICIEDATPRELAMLLFLLSIMMWMGVYPQPFLDLVEPSVKVLLNAVVNHR